MMAGVRVEEPIGDVSENGGASRRDAAFGDQSEEAGEKLAEIDSRREFGELREEVGGKVFRIVVQLEGSGGFGQAEMVRTEAEVRLRASEAATITAWCAGRRGGRSRCGRSMWGTFFGSRSCQRDFGNAGCARCAGRIRM